MNPTLRNLLAAASDAYASNVTEADGWGEDRLHASDVSACTRAVWYRRQAAAGALEHARPAFDAATRFKMARGRGIEDELVKHLRWAFASDAWLVHTQLALAFRIPMNEPTGVRYLEDPATLAPDEGVAHVDFAAVDPASKTAIVLECKSISYLPKEPITAHAQQCGTYAWLIACLPTLRDYTVHAVVRYISAVSGESLDFEIDWRAHAYAYAQALYERARDTARGTPKPEAQPPDHAFTLEPERTASGAKSRAKNAPLVLVNTYCDYYCDYAQCERWREASKTAPATSVA